MKYALNEKEIIIQKKHKEAAENKMKSAVKEKDEAVTKAKNAIADRLKLQQLADSRVKPFKICNMYRYRRSFMHSNVILDLAHR